MTPALDLQVATPLTDGLRPQASQSNETDTGQSFGVAFQASLSASGSSETPGKDATFTTHAAKSANVVDQETLTRKASGLRATGQTLVLSGSGTKFAVIVTRQLKSTAEQASHTLLSANTNSTESDVSVAAGLLPTLSRSQKLEVEAATTELGSTKPDAYENLVLKDFKLSGKIAASGATQEGPEAVAVSLAGDKVESADKSGRKGIGKDKGDPQSAAQAVTNTINPTVAYAVDSTASIAVASALVTSLSTGQIVGSNTTSLDTDRGTSRSNAVTVSSGSLVGLSGNDLRHQTAERPSVSSSNIAALTAVDRAAPATDQLNSGSLNTGQFERTLTASASSLSSIREGSQSERANFTASPLFSSAGGALASPTQLTAADSGLSIQSSAGAASQAVPAIESTVLGENGIIQTPNSEAEGVHAAKPAVLRGPLMTAVARQPSEHAAGAATNGAATSLPSSIAPQGADLRHAVGQPSTQTAVGGGERPESASTPDAKMTSSSTSNQKVLSPQTETSQRGSSASAGVTALPSEHHAAGQVLTTAGASLTADDAAGPSTPQAAGLSTAAALPNHTAPLAASDGTTFAAGLVSNVAATIAHRESTFAPASSLPTGGGLVDSATRANGTDLTHNVSSLNPATVSLAHQTLAATPTMLEVGVHSGTQGWLKIRAEVGDQGDVTTSLAANSVGGEQMLRGQLPALNAYLHSQLMSVTTSLAESSRLPYNVSSHESLAGSMATDTGAAGRDGSLMHRGTDQSANEQNGRQPADIASATTLLHSRANEGDVSNHANSLAGTSSGGLGGSGHWLNVRV